MAFDWHRGFFVRVPSLNALYGVTWIVRARKPRLFIFARRWSSRRTV